MTSEKRAALLPYGLLVVVAAASRLVVAYLFLGSVDIVNDTVDSASMLDGSLLSAHVPYLPGVHLLLWLGGQLAVRSALPVAFCYKVFPCLFDSLIAVLIAGSAGRRLGYLYAFAPVPVIIAALHGQWDGVFLYFLILSTFLLRLGTRSGDVFAGVAFVLSVIAKPVAVPLLLFLFPAPWLLFGRRHDRDARMRTVTLIVAMAATTAAYLLLLRAIGTRLGIAEIRFIFSYAQHGVQLMGFPMFNDVPRSIGLVSLALLLPAYWSGRLSRERAMLLFFAVVLGVCGSAPQYLTWIVPFAIVSFDLAFAALYNFVCAITLLLYYQAPGTLGRNLENLGTFAPLRRFAWLAPPMTSLSEKSQIVFYSGDVIIPLIAIAFFVIAMLQMLRRPRPFVETAPVTPIQCRAVCAPLLVVALLLGAGCVWARVGPAMTGDEFTRRVRGRIEAEYWCVRLVESNPHNPKAPVWVMPSYADPSIAARPVNAFTIGIGWTFLWTFAASAMAIRMRGTAS
ncbi:MAG TPA: hypothetical protein VGQ21_02270 [Thermoanaerobaculia bacterium]|jgi:hypothetical protein|nr:hypothetical protein [Thermoanaerobaculia bacterium]